MAESGKSGTETTTSGSASEISCGSDNVASFPLPHTSADAPAGGSPHKHSFKPTGYNAMGYKTKRCRCGWEKTYTNGSWRTS